MSFVFEGHLFQHLESRRMEGRVQHLKDHYVLCGYGRVGRQVARELSLEGIVFVVVDTNPDSLEQASHDGYPVVHGNAADDDVLRHAGIARARGLIAAVAEDADHIFLSLSAHALRPELPIVARANAMESVCKLHLAGASHVMSPYTMAGQQMAILALRPSAVHFVETLLRGERAALLLEDVVVSARSPLVGTTVAETHQRFLGTTTQVALRRDHQVLAPLADDVVIEAGDTLALTGTEMQLREVETVCLDGDA
jgi:voltage-gated potassium channel